MDQIRLATNESVLDLAPGLGGGIARLKIGGYEILRPMPSLRGQARSPLDLAEFPMAPWVNRVAGGRFDWLGQGIDVARSPAGGPQGLHGIAWRQSWDIAEATPCAAVLALHWPGGPGWPFAFRLSRRFVLAADHAVIDMRIENAGEGDMPAALGFHPYFPAAGAWIRANVGACWATDTEGICSHRLPSGSADDLRQGSDANRLDLDTCFEDWDGLAHITWPTHAISVSAAPGLRHLQIYTPQGEDYFCVEPQSAMPDMLNRQTLDAGFVALRPGESMSAQLRIGLESTSLASNPPATSS
jgi:aldose 1-epimerase